MAYSIRPATRADSKALIGLYGQSGSGKTMSALLLARGLVGPAGRLVLIDTESGRGSLYADVIPGGYDVIDLNAPFSPLSYMEALDAAEKAGAACIVIDSVSHEWEGIGGVGDMAAQIEARTGKPGLHCWKEPKLAHQKMLLKLLQSRTHIICCLRAKRKSRQVKNERTGKNEIVKDDFYSPKQDGDFIFEMQVHAEILADHTLRVTKVSHPALSTIFRDGVVISEETGRALAEWARGDALRLAPHHEPAKKLSAAEQKVKMWNEQAVGTLNLSEQSKESLASFWKENAAKIDWMEQNMPAEYEKLLNVYDLAMERAAARVS